MERLQITRLHEAVKLLEILLLTPSGGLALAEVLLFHHAQGLTRGVRKFAKDLQAAGHIVVQILSRIWFSVSFWRRPPCP